MPIELKKADDQLLADIEEINKRNAGKSLVIRWPFRMKTRNEFPDIVAAKAQ